MRKLLSTSLCLLAIALVATRADAQSQATTGEVNGRVTDAQGGVLPGASVTLTNPATGYTRTVVTGGEGYYVAPLLPPAAYDVSFEMSGLESQKRKANVTVGSTVTINAALGVGGVREEVTVVSESPLVETTSSVRTSTLDQTAIANLPINGRRFQDFITLTPDGAGRSPARPALVLRPARDQLQRQRGRGRLQPAVLRRHPRRRALEHRLHDPAGGDPGVPGRGRRVQRGVRAIHGRARERDHEVGDEQLPRLRLLPEPQPRLGGGQRVRTEARRPPSSSSAAPSAAPSRRTRRSSSAPSRSSSSRTRGRCSSTGWPGSRRPPPPRRPSSTTSRWRRRSRPPTTPGRPWPGSTTSSTAANRLSVRYSHSDNTALNANATGNALDPNTISALSNNGTEKNNTNIVIGQFTSSFELEPAARGPRPVGARGAAAPGQRGDPDRPDRHRQLRHRELPAHHAVRQALPGRGEPHLDPNKHTVKFGHRIQPRLRRPALRLQPVRPVHGERDQHRHPARRPGNGRGDRQPVRHDRRHLPAAARQPPGRLRHRRGGAVRPGQLEAPPELHRQRRPALGGRLQPDARGLQHHDAQPGARLQLPASAAPPTRRCRSRARRASSDLASASPGIPPRTAARRCAATPASTTRARPPCSTPAR